MRIEKDMNEDYENEAPSATEAMEASMEAIMQYAIMPAIENGLVNEEGEAILGLVGGVLKKIASKAQAYEQVFGGDLPENYKN